MIGLFSTLALAASVGVSPGTRSEQSAPSSHSALSTEGAPQPATTKPASQGNTVNARGAATKAFLDRIQEYVRFHNNVEKMVPPLKQTTDLVEIAHRENALGDALIKQRPDAKPGDFFIAQYQPVIIQIIKEDFAKRSLADRKALIVELPKGVSIDVNKRYPTDLPLASFPGNLLKVLPELPPQLEYRIVGRHLILFDVKGNVIVDLMRNVVPIPA